MIKVLLLLLLINYTLETNYKFSKINNQIIYINKDKINNKYIKKGNCESVDYVIN